MHIHTYIYYTVQETMHLPSYRSVCANAILVHFSDQVRLVNWFRRSGSALYHEQLLWGELVPNLAHWHFDCIPLFIFVYIQPVQLQNHQPGRRKAL